MEGGCTLGKGCLERQAVSDQSAAAEETRHQDTPDDVRLVEAARQGDRAAFGLLYDRYARMVHGIMLLLGAWIAFRILGGDNS